MEYCETCVYCDKTKSVCLYYGMQIDIDKDFCSKHAKQINYCEVCRNPMAITNTFLEQDENGEWHQYCSRCAKILTTCQACPMPCEFQSNPDPMPKVVMKTVQQGNMQMQAQIMNPERVKKFCSVCGCYDEEAGCKRQFNVGCDKKPNFWSSRNS